MSRTVALERDVDPAALAEKPWAHLGEDAAWRLDAVESAPGRIDTGPAMAAAAAALRQPFIDWIGALGERNDSPEWWASELAAKNPFTHMFSRICALRTGLALDEDVEVVCSSPALAALLRGEEPGPPTGFGEAGRRRAVRGALGAWARTAPSPLLGLPGRLLSRAGSALGEDLEFRRRSLEAAGVQRIEGFAGEDTALLVTWADARSVGRDGRYTDPHLGPLGGMLRDAGLRVAYMPQPLHTLSFAELARRLAATGEPLAWAELYLERSDVRESAARARAFAPEIPSAPPELGGEGAAALAREHVEEFRSRLARTLRMEALPARLAASGVRPGLVVLPFEGHSWEQSLVLGLRREIPEAQIVGYDNVNFSSLALSLYPAAGEWERRPLPDRVVTNGPVFTRVLEREGWPAERVRTGAGLRHSYLHERPAAPAAERPRTVLVALTIDLAQSVEMVRKAAAAFEDAADWRVVVKPHPALPGSELRRLVRTSERLEWSEGSLPEALAGAGVMLYGYSVAPYEALAAGVAPLLVQSESGIDLDQLEPFPGLGGRARTPEEIRAAAGALRARTGDPAWREEAGRAVSQALAPVGEGCLPAYLRTPG